MLKKTQLYYFSPTGGTRKAAEIFTKEISEDFNGVDIGAADELMMESDDELTVIAAPVFGGRIPAIVAEKISKLCGDGHKAVTLVVYGNRAYEDALLELNTVVETAGFEVIASAALVAQHSMAPEVGKGRPDEQDRAEIEEFANKVLKKIKRQLQILRSVFYVWPVWRTVRNRLGFCRHHCKTRWKRCWGR